MQFEELVLRQKEELCHSIMVGEIKEQANLAKVIERQCVGFHDGYWEWKNPSPDPKHQ